MSPSGGYKLRVLNLRKTFGSLVALEGASLEVGEGEFLTLLGPSGSGKTTLLLAVAGLNDPDAGEIWIDGRPTTYLPPYKRDIGMVFQNYALFPHMTVFENIAFPLRMRHRPRSEIGELVPRILEIIQLPDIAQRYPRQLSGGQQQRVALARALVYGPPVVLMDEPLGALDRKLRQQLQFEIKRLHAELNFAALYVTHDQEEALVMSDRICLMREGRIEQLGTPAELYFRPRTTFAAEFLGESNLLNGRMVKRFEGKAVVRLDDGTEVRGLIEDDIVENEAVTVMVRPESISVLHGEESAGNVISARMTDSVMLGGTTKCFFRSASGLHLHAQVLTGSLLEPGDRRSGMRRLGWSCERTVVLRDTSEAANGGRDQYDEVSERRQPSE